MIYEISKQDTINVLTGAPQSHFTSTGIGVHQRSRWPVGIASTLTEAKSLAFNNWKGTCSLLGSTYRAKDVVIRKLTKT